MNKKIKNEKITISFRNTDSDIVEFLEELKKENMASQFIREAIRDKMEKKDTEVSSINDIMGKLEELTKRVEMLEGKKEHIKEHVKEPEIENVKKAKDLNENSEPSDMVHGGLVVNKADRFGQTKNKEKEKKKESEKLEDALDFYQL